ncbi:uncharacterized protein SPSK_08068 [Sporothrix schenckii 1099-18]|uniref:Uncharacterized protein n=1 Tax=Sporothrix schenckii 1099-18 TaxID=1397361 RepID=A0A0F2MKV3_SPOSC|nr:uncharacterized protein SPSK_08068 [Sporothrix schenckii 1099-18]KJR88821.1 hypothetical protein SPSK_08068 [Sporothrix schenckii 1099-18]
MGYPVYGTCVGKESRKANADDGLQSGPHGPLGLPIENGVGVLSGRTTHEQIDESADDALAPAGNILHKRLMHWRLDPTAHRCVSRTASKSDNCEWEEEEISHTAATNLRGHGRAKEQGKEKRKYDTRKLPLGPSRKLFLDVQRICF